jgi:hypothetical protein
LGKDRPGQDILDRTAGTGLSGTLSLTGQPGKEREDSLARKKTGWDRITRTGKRGCIARTGKPRQVSLDKTA